MPTRRAPWTDAMLTKASHDWTALELVLRAGMAAVPPGRALAARERNVTRLRRRFDHAGPNRTDRSDDERIRTGARIIATKSLHHLISSGHLERDGDRVRRPA